MLADGKSVTVNPMFFRSFRHLQQFFISLATDLPVDIPKPIFRPYVGSDAVEPLETDDDWAIAILTHEYQNDY
jgi:hypothetical protein